MKPRIYKVPGATLWRCVRGNYRGIGRSPVMAYRNWIRCLLMFAK